MVAVAQLVESQIVILVVVGSSPISHPNYFAIPCYRVDSKGVQKFPEWEFTVTGGAPPGCVRTPLRWSSDQRAIRVVLQTAI